MNESVVFCHWVLCERRFASVLRTESITHTKRNVEAKKNISKSSGDMDITHLHHENSSARQVHFPVGIVSPRISHHQHETDHLPHQQ